MKIYLHNEDILSVPRADTIMLPVDGNAPGLYGSVTQRFMRYMGVESMDELYSPPAEYPFLSRWTRVDCDKFKWFVAVSVLSHKPDVDHRAQLKRAFYEAIDAQVLTGDLGNRIATPVLTGGHRMRPVDALITMLEVATKLNPKGMELHIVERDEKLYNAFRPLVG